MEDDVGRDALLLGRNRSPRAEELEANSGIGGEFGLDRLGAASGGGGFCSFRRPLDLGAHHHRAFPAQHLSARIGEHERAVVALDADEALGKELADHTAPLGVAVIGTDAEYGQLIVVMLHHFVCALTGQDVDDLAGTELLVSFPLKPRHCGENLLSLDGSVPLLGWAQTGVAVPAWFAGLAEVVEELHPSALHGLAQREHGVEMLSEPSSMGGVAVRRVDHAALLHDVLEPVGEPCRGGQAVTPSAPGLLVVPLDGLGKIEVGDEANVGFVDAHAERDGGDDDEPVLAEETRLVVRPHAVVEAGVVRDGWDPVVVEELGGLLDRCPRQAVDDAGVTLVLAAEKIKQLTGRVGLPDDAVLDVGPVEGGDEVPGVVELEARCDLGVRRLGRRGRQRNPRYVRPPLVEVGEHEVLRPEVVAPLRHAMRFVDGEERDRASLEQPHGRLDSESLRREIEQIEAPGQEVTFDLLALLRALRGVEESGSCTDGAQRVDLVLHQGDQRGDDHPGTFTDEGGHLVAE